MLKVCLVGIGESQIEPLKKEWDIEVIELPKLRTETVAEILHNQPHIAILHIDKLPKGTVLATISTLKGQIPKIVVRGNNVDASYFFDLLDAGVDSLLSDEVLLDGSVIRAILSNQFKLPSRFTDILIDEINSRKVTNMNILSQRLTKRKIFVTNREADIAYYVKQGLPNGEIASKLRLAEGTVKLHISQLYKKTKRKRRRELVLFLEKVMAAEGD